MVCALCALLSSHYNPSYAVCETSTFRSFTYTCGAFSVRTISRSDHSGTRSRRLAHCPLRNRQSSRGKRGALSRQELRVPARSHCRTNGRHRKCRRKLPGNHVKQFETERVCVVATREDCARHRRSRSRARAFTATRCGCSIESAFRSSDIAFE